MKYVKKIPVKHYENSEYVNIQDSIIWEKVINIKINGKTYTHTVLPEHLEYFIYGYLFNNYFIERINDIANIKLGDPDIEIKLRIKRRKKMLKQLINNINIDPEAIIKNTKMMVQMGKYFPITGGTHLSALFDRNKFLIAFEDVSRHNCLDKITGFILKNQLNRERLYIYITSRLSASILQKVVRTRIPIIVSKSAVTSQAIEMGKKFNVKIIGFSRNGYFNLYC